MSAIASWRQHAKSVPSGANKHAKQHQRAMLYQPQTSRVDAEPAHFQQRFRFPPIGSGGNGIGEHVTFRQLTLTETHRALKALAAASGETIRSYVLELLRRDGIPKPE